MGQFGYYRRRFLGIFKGKQVKRLDRLKMRFSLDFIGFFGDFEWLPRRDSNPNKQNQNLRCYHYRHQRPCKTLIFSLSSLHYCSYTHNPSHHIKASQVCTFTTFGAHPKVYCFVLRYCLRHRVLTTHPPCLIYNTRLSRLSVFAHNKSTYIMYA